MSTTDTPLAQLAIRMPAWLRDEIKRQAEKNERTMNAEVTFRLKSAYSEEKEKAGSPLTA